MAKNISFKEFMDQVEMRLKAFSAEALREMLLEWARNTHPSKRSEFLAGLAPAPVVQNALEPDEGLLEDIGELAKRVEGGDYSEGWGWDDAIHEERDWGDESWADEADEFFSQAHEAMTAGHYKLARDAYARLFDILDMGEEPGHLPGSNDPQDMLDTDLGEARAGYLRSVYLSSSAQERPAGLLQAMQRFRYYIGDDLNLQSIINIEREPLPDLTQFLREWIDILKRTAERFTSYLLREAVRLSGGTSALARLSRNEGARYPTAYVDWIKALEKDGDYQAVLEAAKEGLAGVPRDYEVRAEIAEGMVRAGEYLRDTNVQLEGWHEAFYSNPSLSNLLSLLSIAEQKGSYRKEIEAAITRVALLLEKGGKSTGRPSTGNRELQESSASGSLLNQAYILAGQYEDSFNLCKNKGALGWSYGQNPKGLVIPFFLKLLDKGKALNTAPNLEHLWQESLSNLSEHSGDNRDLATRFEKAIEKVMRTIQLSEEEEKEYLGWCIEETGRRVEAIVGEKHRQSYYQAANLLVALAEVLANRGKELEGKGLVERHSQRYSHYSAFRKELNAAKGKSGIFSHTNSE